MHGAFTLGTLLKHSVIFTFERKNYITSLSKPYKKIIKPKDRAERAITNYHKSCVNVQSVMTK